MRSQAADRVLGDVHRRLQLQRNADAMRRAAWLPFVVTGIAVTLHFLVRPVAPVEVVVAVVAVWSIAVVGARLPTIDRRECAAWADRHLDGACAFETYLERRDGPALPPGVEHQFADSLEQLSRGAADRLRALPVESNLRRPLALAAVGLLLAVVLLQVPVQVRTADRDGGDARVTAAPPAASGSPSSPASGGDESPTRARPASPEPSPATQGATTRGPGATGGDPAELGDEAAVDRASESANGGANGGATAKRPGTGGQEAGDTADTAENPSLSEAWKGAMAARFRELAAPPEAATRADPTLAATYSPEDTRQATAAESNTAQPAAAVPPPARHASSPGPAERAYVRAYLSLQGATP
jgi:hypothetical protein